MAKGSFYLDANRKSNVRNDMVFKKPSLTEQQHKSACDINNIVKQYVMQGYRSQDFLMLSDRVFKDASRFVDCTEAVDLMTASDLMFQAQESFIQNVPAKIREQYDHDAMAFYKACLDTNGDAKKIRALFSDVNNYAVPNAEQLSDGNHSVDQNNSSDKKE